MGEVLVGITSWTEPSLIKSGRFYPASARSAEARLRFYAGQFPIVEVDSTYYALPSKDNSRLWVERTPDSFVFDVKAFRLFTQHPTSPLSLPKDILEALPPEHQQKLLQKKNLYDRDLPSAVVDELWQRMDEALDPLHRAGKLGVVLFQFPAWFFPGNEQRSYIARCQEKMSRYRIAVEFRHNSWLSDKNRDRTFTFLRENNLPYVCVDEPQGFSSSVPPIAEATSDVSVVRFHGRNREAWEGPEQTAAARFNYLYSESELGEWEPKIRQLSTQTRQLHVLFNNCYQDKATTNASQMRAMLD
jgi:uncharacterized protein YecE (DUF72 family)